MNYSEFVGSYAAQQRYWARSHLGWRRIATATPNAGHRGVAALARRGLIDQVITQNVDGLHESAGTPDVIDLHGRLDRVICLDCNERSTRPRLADRLTATNSGWDAEVLAQRPDGDVVVSDDDIAQFVIVGCEGCGGRLKPDVVFFGENVPRSRVEASFAAVEAARSLVVLGSSLTVASGYRFVRHAAKLGHPIAIVNQGETRGDPLASLVIDAPLGTTLTRLAAALADPINAPAAATPHLG